MAIGFLSFGVSLDRYPFVYQDETFYNYPAARYLEGKGFNWRTRDEAPHADTVWAYHAPFYPRLQVLTFKLLGDTQFAWRIPQYLAAHLALLALCLFLLRRGLYKSAIALPVIWLGDRSLQEVVWGRMEGLALLFLVLAFISLIKFFESGRFTWVALTSACLGIAVGFHPLSAYMACGAGIVIFAARPVKSWPRIAAGLVAGGLLPALLWIVCWLPELRASLEQFRWSLTLADTYFSKRGLDSLVAILRWSKYWVIALSVLTVFGLMPKSALELARRKFSNAKFIYIAATGFAVAWILMAANHQGAMSPYYLVYFTLWPTVAGLVMLETETWRASVLNKIVVALAVVVAVAWLPSAAWNAMRFREMALNYRTADPKLFADKLSALVPPGTEVTGSPVLYTFARKAGLHFTPLSPHVRNVEVAPDTWVLLAPKDLALGRVAGENLARREIRFEGEAFPEATHVSTRYKFLLYGPIVRAD